MFSCRFISGALQDRQPRVLRIALVGEGSLAEIKDRSAIGSDHPAKRAGLTKTDRRTHAPPPPCGGCRLPNGPRKRIRLRTAMEPDIHRAPACDGRTFRIAPYRSASPIPNRTPAFP